MAITYTIEDLAGTKDGSNKTFTISSAPIIETLLVVHGVQALIRSGSPGVGEYSISGTTITLGTAPLSGDNLWARYGV